MPSLTFPPTPLHTPPPSTKEKLDYADLAVIDISKARTAEGRLELAAEVKNALLTHGFFYVINHGYKQDETDRMFDIAEVPFSGVSNEEKQPYTHNIKESGSFQGYKRRSYWHIDNGVQDQLESYNIHRNVNKLPHPPALCPFLPEIEAFCKHNFFNVIHPIFRLIALSLEIPEETLVNMHNYDAEGETYVRLVKYYPRSEDEIKTNNVWLKGHKDFGSITILWSQPVAALQIMAADGNWRWVRHIDNALVVNAGEALEFLTGGYYKGTIHRVRQPPPDQQGYERLGIINFVLTDDDVELTPLTGSPVLQRAGIYATKDDNAPTMKAWRQSRASAFGTSELKKGTQQRVEEDVINGIVVKYYS
ncbi:hypothetical protein SERLA73DRAFT_105822 [Serpula lacrymans var. lacrymans S7.3]|uniref:Fe2OG dioxygenase domain-containing protein n=2 Tax=Serpula lacrymans var. lacrymans TaxID=341189 RepID=F8PRX1_SERL3|nr:uncharacterized protein SERLADRAFT_360900 [Serpula lacrymans var. lacrymans S7.9]EGO01206.1 hypothetical protein SERLA73DRAFT_105822 [Serpula lacrymans var. lacrymans S7.3]EGO26855.1 hypothetical protein SERLADRAFT_360900 [Serpula lacrymans var. lacrymans S7.9]